MHIIGIRVVVITVIMNAVRDQTLCACGGKLKPLHWICCALISTWAITEPTKADMNFEMGLM